MALKTRLLLRQFDGFLSPGVRVDGLPAAVRRARLPHLPRAARGGQRDVRRGGGAVPRTRGARGGTAAHGHRSRRVRPAVRRQAGAVEAAAATSCARSRGWVPARRCWSAGVGAARGRDARSRPSDSASSMVMAGFLNQRELGEAYGSPTAWRCRATAPKRGGSSSTKRWRPDCRAWSAMRSAARRILIRDGETGYVVPLDDVEAMAAALAKVRRRNAEGYRLGPGVPCDRRRVQTTAR